MPPRNDEYDDVEMDDIADSAHDAYVALNGGSSFADVVCQLAWIVWIIFIDFKWDWQGMERALLQTLEPFLLYMRRRRNVMQRLRNDAEHAN